MAGGLDNLLRKDASHRNQDDYDAVFDDFFLDLGGQRVADFVSVPENTDNADYIIPRDDYAILVELKQIRTNDPFRGYFHHVFSYMAEHGGISLGIGGTGLAIVGKPPHRGRWLTFHDSVRPKILKDLKKANRQLAGVEELLAERYSRVVRGVMLFNTADYQLSNDLLRVIIDRRMTESWGADHFRAIDFVIFGTIDLGRQGRLPYEVFMKLRTIADQMLRDVPGKFFEDWQSYVIREIGEGAHKEFCDQKKMDGADLSTSFEGKLQRRI